MSPRATRSSACASAARMVPPWVTAMMSRPACSSVRRRMAGCARARSCDEALAAGRRVMRRRQPEARPAIAVALGELGIGHALPLAEMLLDEIGLDDDTGTGDRIGSRQPGADDAGRRHMRALQRARHPDGVARQQPRQAGESGLVAAIAGMVGLAIAAALIDGDRRMAHPPPSRHDTHDEAASSITISPACSDRAEYVAGVAADLTAGKAGNQRHRDAGDRQPGDAGARHPAR